MTLKHGSTALLAFLFCITQAQALEVVKDKATVKIGAPGKPCIEYRFANVPFKPYVSQLYTPAGVAVLRDSPFDHKHHHGLMFAIAADGADFWAELPKCGKQLDKQLDTGKDSLAQKLDWTTPDGKQVLSEERTVTIQENKDLSATLLTWRSKLQTPAGMDEVKLTGSHYFGLGMRFVTSMDKVAAFINAAGHTGDVVRGTERLSPAKWCACSAPAGDKMVTVAIFDHPSNLRHPARIFTMLEPFSYMSATLNLWKEPFMLKSGQPLDLKYGVAAWDGKIDKEQIENTYQQWLKLNL